MIKKTKAQILESLEGEHSFYSNELQTDIEFYYTPAFDEAFECPSDIATIEIISVNNSGLTDYEEPDYLLACAGYIVEQVQSIIDIQDGI